MSLYLLYFTMEIARILVGSRAPALPRQVQLSKIIKQHYGTRNDLRCLARPWIICPASFQQVSFRMARGYIRTCGGRFTSVYCWNLACGTCKMDDKAFAEGWCLVHLQINWDRFAHRTFHHLAERTWERYWSYVSKHLLLCIGLVRSSAHNNNAWRLLPFLDELWHRCGLFLLQHSVLFCDDRSNFAIYSSLVG